MTRFFGSRFTESAILTFVLLEAGFAQEVKLEFKFTKGDVKRYRTTLTNQRVYEFRGYRPRAVATEYFETFTVDSVYADGSADMIDITDSVLTTVNNERVAVNQERQLVGIPILKKISKSGVLLDIRALKEVPEEGKWRIDSDRDDPENKFGFPDKAIAVGEMWDHEQTISQNTPEVSEETLLKTKWRLLGFERMMGFACSVIRISGNVTGTWTAADESGKYDGTARGTVHFADKEGHHVRWFIEYDASGTVMTPDRTIDFKVHSGYKYELLK